jgi:uncharacterized protein YodC (DUF2158 family)
MEFSIGDTVQLKSGGPLMTIDHVIGTGPDDEVFLEEGLKPGDVICQWFCNDRIQGKAFKSSVLLKVEFCTS